MNIPEFTAEASLYRSSISYRSSGHNFGGLPSSQSVFPALTTERFANCDACQKSCFKTYSYCLGSASAGYAIAAVGCAAAVFPPAIAICEGVAAGVYAAASATCLATSYACLGICELPGQECCPVFCELGHCCSDGETCIPHGCCPPGQVVCDGKCCDVGDSCCGGTCCPSHYFCRDGFCSEFAGPSLWPTDTTPPKSPETSPYSKYCGVGQKRCGDKCCPVGLECCSIGGGQVACMTNCLH
jgi:hypothetical protein